MIEYSTVSSMYIYTGVYGLTQVRKLHQENLCGVHLHGGLDI